MRENGQKTKRKVMGLKDFQIDAFTRDNTKAASRMVSVATLGQMENIMMESG